MNNSFGSFGASPPPRQSHDMTPPGDMTLEPPVSPRTSVDSKSYRSSSSPPKFDQPKFSTASPQTRQSLRNSQKSLQEAKLAGKEEFYICGSNKKNLTLDVSVSFQ